MGGRVYYMRLGKTDVSCRTPWLGITERRNYSNAEKPRVMKGSFNPFPTPRTKARFVIIIISSIFNVASLMRSEHLTRLQPQASEYSILLALPVDRNSAILIISAFTIFLLPNCVQFRPRATFVIN